MADTDNRDMSRAAALRAVGFWQPVDTLACFLTAVSLTGLAASCIAGALSLAAVFVWLALTLLLVLLWAVALVFRCMWFVLQITAEIKMMPSAAAKMALALISGRPQ